MTGQVIVGVPDEWAVANAGRGVPFAPANQSARFHQQYNRGLFRGSLLVIDSTAGTVSAYWRPSGPISTDI